MTTALSTVSNMTEREFGVVFSKLAIQLRWVDADVVAIKSYFDALKDLPLVTVERAAQGFAKEPGRKWFPTTAEWYEAASAQQTALLRDELPHRAAPWKHDCAACEDTGWVQGLSCPESPCGREKAHQPHTYVRVCPCRATNRTWLRHQRFGSGE